MKRTVLTKLIGDVCLEKNTERQKELAQSYAKPSASFIGISHLKIMHLDMNFEVRDFLNDLQWFDLFVCVIMTKWAYLWSIVFMFYVSKVEPDFTHVFRFHEKWLACAAPLLTKVDATFFCWIYKIHCARQAKPCNMVALQNWDETTKSEREEFLNSQKPR